MFYTMVYEITLCRMQSLNLKNLSTNSVLELYFVMKIMLTQGTFDEVIKRTKGA